MKYDLTRCNNLNFRLNDGTKGFIKVSPSKDAYLYSDECGWDILRAMPRYKMVACLTNGDVAAAYVAKHGLEIIPRGPLTYNNWKVGDKVIGKTGKKVYTIIAVLGGAAVVSLDSDVHIVGLATFEELTKYNNLVLTDYEIELLAPSKEKKEGWINLYKNSDNFLYVMCNVFSTKEKAKNCHHGSDYIATVKIEWEE